MQQLHRVPPAALPSSRGAPRQLQPWQLPPLQLLAQILLLLLLLPPCIAQSNMTDDSTPSIVIPNLPLLAAGMTPVITLATGPDTFRATIRTDSIGRPISQILGVSVEWGRVADYAPARWARVFGQLGPRPVIRIGGGSTEMLQAMPPPSSWHGLRALAENSGARYIINLKLSGGDLNFTSALYERSISELGPHILNFELGNEPAYWSGLQQVGGYSPSGNFTPGWTAYNAYYVRAARRLVEISNAYPIMGPSWHHIKAGWSTQDAKNFAAAARGTNLKELAVHYFPSYSKPAFTTQHLLSEGLVRDAIDGFTSLAAAVPDLGVRVSEANSMYHGGTLGMSDTMAAALWTVDWAFELAAAGATGFNLHWREGGSPDGAPGPNWPCYYMGVETRYRTGLGGVQDTYPEAKAPWYGYLLFARATLTNSGPATLATVPAAAASPTCTNVKIWPLLIHDDATGDAAARDAAAGDPSQIRIVVLNKKPSGACRVVVKLEGSHQEAAGADVSPSELPAGGYTSDHTSGYGYGDGRLQWLLPGGAGLGGLEELTNGMGCGEEGCRGGFREVVGAEGLGSVRGLTLGGQVMDGEGRLQPAKPEEYVVRANVGMDGGLDYAFTLPAATGVLLTVDRL